MNAVFILLLIKVVNGLFLVHPKYWNYDPKPWNDTLLCITGEQQSPINIVSNYTVPLPSNLQIPQFYNSKTMGLVTVWNNGRTGLFDGICAVKLHSNGKISVQIQGFEQWRHKDRPFMVDETGQKFLLFRIHLHWSYENKTLHNASEHSINDKKHHGEIHLAYRFDDDDMDLGEALQSGNVRMVAVFFDVHAWVAHKTYVLTNLDYALTHIEKYDSQALDVPFAVDPILTTVKDGMYIYNGSLTTPNCMENIRWYVMKAPVAIAPYQIESLHKVADRDKVFAIPNTRSIQAHNKRRIYDVKASKVN